MIRQFFVSYFAHVRPDLELDDVWYGYDVLEFLVLPLKRTSTTNDDDDHPLTNNDKPKPDPSNLPNLKPPRRPIPRRLHPPQDPRVERIYSDGVFGTTRFVRSRKSSLAPLVLVVCPTRRRLRAGHQTIGI